MKSDIRNINHKIDEVEKKLLKTCVLMGYSNVNLDKSQKLLQFETKKSLLENSNGLKIQINYSDEGDSTELIISCDWLPTLGVKPLINISDKLFKNTIDDFLNNLEKILTNGSHKNVDSSNQEKGIVEKTVIEEIRDKSNSTNKKNNTIMYFAVAIAIFIVLYLAFVGF